MKAPDVLTVDFETFPIRSMPHYPPRPVGCAFKYPRENSYYVACGHPTGNNATLQDVMRELERAWDSGLPLLFHHAKFDVAVACKGGGMRELPWDRIHDSMFLAYLCDPHARQLGLKELAEDLLSWPPEERDAVKEWVLDHKQALVTAYAWNRKTNKKTGQPVNNISPKDVGAWIFAAPGDVVGPYACGDVDRTAALFEHLWPIVQENGMGGAYDRERELMPILLDNELEGMRTDLERLEEDIEIFGGNFRYVEDWLRGELRASGLNFDADADVADVLLSRGIVPKDNWSLTAKGSLSMSKDALFPEHFTGPNGAAIASALGYRNRLKTCLDTFMRPWAAQARENNGYITTNWNQTRGGEGGTRTGRPSTNRHNFLNVSKKWTGRDDGYEHPDFLGVDQLPLCRCYILPDPGEVWLHRDFSGQEMRIFADVEQGDLWLQYAANPDLDPHAFVGEEVQRVLDMIFGPGVRTMERAKIKTLNFQGLYGGGAPAAAAKLRVSLAEAKDFKAFHDKALPGRKIVNDEIKRIIGRGDAIRTLGGRLYFAEPPGPDHRSKIYKLINYWIQGGAADYTKQALIDCKRAGMRSRFLVTVYDEINRSAHPDIKVSEMKLLREVMETPRLGMTVPMRSDGKWGPTWGDLEKCA